MEGFIPFLLQKIKKQKPGNSFRCCSEGSTTTRSYHMLIGPDSSYDGSSHRRTRSDFQPPADQLGAIELAHSRSLKLNNVSDASKLSYFTYGSRRIHSGTYDVPKEADGGNVLRRKH